MVLIFKYFTGTIVTYTFFEWNISYHSLDMKEMIYIQLLWQNSINKHSDHAPETKLIFLTNPQTDIHSFLQVYFFFIFKSFPKNCTEMSLSFYDNFLQTDLKHMREALTLFPDKISSPNVSKKLDDVP